MLTSDDILLTFQSRVHNSVRLLKETASQYSVDTPFVFNDGDHLRIILKLRNQQWVLSDLGHTLMRLSYNLDEDELEVPTRQKVITDALSLYDVRNESGELTIPVPEDNDIDVLHNFVQAILRISDVQLLTRELVRSTFMADFKALIESAVPEPRRKFDWFDPQHDPKANYRVDCRVNGMKSPLMVFGIPSDNKTSVVTITLLQFERWRLAFNSLAIFEDQETIGRSVLARFSDVAGKQYSSLSANIDRIRSYLEEQLAAS